MNLLKIFMLSTISMIISGTFAAEKPSALDLLDKYTMNQDKLNSSVIIKLVTEEKLLEDKKITDTRSVPSEVRLDGQKLFGCLNYNYNLVKDKNISLDEMDYRNFHLWDGEKYIEYNDGGTPSWSWAFLAKQNMSNIFLRDNWCGSPLFGVRVHSGDRIDTIIRKCEKISVRDKGEMIDSELCYVIDANNSTASYTIWLNTNHGYSISKATFTIGPKTQGDLFNLSEDEKLNFTLTDVKFKQFGDIHVPMSYKAHWERLNKQDKVREVLYSGNVEDIKFNPDHDKLNSFKPKMRDGIEVRDDKTGLTYTWNGEKMIAAIDELIIKQLDETAQQLVSKGEVPSKLGSVEELANNDSKSDKIKDTKINNIDPQQQILSETKATSLFVLIPVGLFAIGVVGWVIIRKRKNYKEV
jgi:hypothetical protein